MTLITIDKVSRIFEDPQRKAPVTALQDLEQAVATFASRAAQKLRQQASHTAHVLVFIHTSPYRAGCVKRRSHRSVSCTRP